jgi:hypothetical protein
MSEQQLSTAVQNLERQYSASADLLNAAHLKNDPTNRAFLFALSSITASRWRATL